MIHWLLISCFSHYERRKIYKIRNIKKRNIPQSSKKPLPSTIQPNQTGKTTNSLVFKPIRELRPQINFYELNSRK